MPEPKNAPECEFLYVHEEIVQQVNQVMPQEETLFDLAELCVCDIAQLLGMTQSAISHQLQVLKKSKLVKYRRDGKTVFYSLADDHVRSILDQGMEHVAE